MRVLYIHQYFTLPAGSAGTRAYEFARYLVEQGHEVTVVTSVAERGGLRATRWIERQRIDGIEVILIDVPYANRMSYPERILAFVKFMCLSTAAGVGCSRPDVVLASSTPLTVGVPGMIAGLWHRAPFVFEVRDLWPKYAIAYGALRNRWLIRIAEALERLCYARADRVVTICETIAQDIREAGGPGDKLVCIPIGADIAPEAPRRDRRAGPFRVVYTGAHSTVNALDFVLDAAHLVAARGLAVEFHFYGDGRDKAALEARAARDGLVDVQFHGFVPKDQIPTILRDADACVISARDIPEARAIFPNKFFDYVAASRPVIVNFPGELADVIAREEIGVVVPPGDATAFADAIERLARTPELCLRLGERARALAAERYDRRSLARQLERVFLEVIGPKVKVASRPNRRAG